MGNIEPQNYRKIDTRIIGLNKLFFDGLDLPDDQPILILIKGGEDTEKLLLGLQLTYNLGLSTGTCPAFYSNYHTKAFLEDLLLDTVIASCIRELITQNIENDNGINNVKFADKIFTISEIVSHCNSIISSEKSITESDINRFLCEEIIHYSNRTNALHLKVIDESDGNSNFLSRRTGDSVNNFVDKFGENEGFLKKYFGSIKIDRIAQNYQQLSDELNSNAYPIIGLAYQSDYTEKSYSVLEQLMLRIRMADSRESESKPNPKPSKKAVILIVDSNCKVPEYLANIVIALDNNILSDYMIQRLRIEKCETQTAALGWHQYKRRDYGIEVFPSLHTYFQKRRYLQRAMVYTHSDVVTDTFQQHLEACRTFIKSEATRTDPKEILDYFDFKTRNKYLEALQTNRTLEFTSDEILEYILLDKYKSTSFTDHLKGLSRQEILYGDHGVTGIVGDANCYKRFLAFGGIFSTAIEKEHTLILLLNKNEEITRRRLLCPACLIDQKSHNCCETCYRYIHFMNINIGCITPDEFIYYFKQQIDIKYKEGKKIRRIVFDDLQVIDFCSPLLKNSSLFLSALMTVCREEKIALYILCDKHGSMIESLRSLADNVICTERDKNGRLLLYVEKFAGYNRTPSKIYCGKVKDVKNLFECRTSYSSEEASTLKYCINSDIVEDDPVHSMDEYWNKK